MPIKYNDNQGNEYKSEAPIFKGGGAEEFLHFMREYSDLCEKVPYDNPGSKTKALESLLKDTALTSWKKCIRMNRPNFNTDNAFNARLMQLKKIYIPQRNALENQRDYMRSIKKNDTLDVTAFLNRLKYICKLIFIVLIAK